MSTNQSLHPRGYWITISTSMGVAVGAGLGVILQSIGAGIALGVAGGAVVGAALERRNRYRIRPPTEQEKRRQRQATRW